MYRIACCQHKYIFKWDVAIVGLALAENPEVAKETEAVVLVDVTV
jgi:hypothetical protein